MPFAAMFSGTIFGLLTLLSSHGYITQSLPLSGAQFDVASIKRSNSTTISGGFRRIDVGILVIQGMTIKDLICNAYNLQSYQLMGLGKWMLEERYDISAKDTSVDPVASRELDQTHWAEALGANYEKLRNLLKERFQLQTHTEKRFLPGYALVVAKKNIAKSAVCGEKYFLAKGIAKGNVRISSLASALSRDMGRPVLDMTGLGGCYYMDLKWTQDPDNSEVSSIAGALNQLGLHLESRKQPGEILVIDHAEKPSLN